MSHSNLDLYLKLIWTWASEHFLHVPPLSPWSFVSNAWILTPGRNILPLIYHLNVNHFNVGRYGRPASLTVGHENAILGLRPIWAEFGAEEEDLLGD
ncbi:hypothetical protein A2U01_0026664 [Trifolium medium]|uniref:Uncharacterized protein n=1 Tax=Trifolium medium TaxID=97028 RepID=A0A392P0P2_9FABA|nr:hypothetical protein [Trifolium medium]